MSTVSFVKLHGIVYIQQAYHRAINPALASSSNINSPAGKEAGSTSNSWAAQLSAGGQWVFLSSSRPRRFATPGDSYAERWSFFRPGKDMTDTAIRKKQL